MARVNIIISIGGTGARVLEAVVHLCASGFFAGEDNINVLIVDPDVDNGNVIRTTDVIKTYRSLFKSIEESGIDDVESRVIFSPSISYVGAESDDEVALYNPADSALGRNLRSYFRLSEFQNSAAIAQSLYAENELDEPLDRGFKGRPSIGSPFMLYRLKEEADRITSMGYANKNWWSELILLLDNATGSRARSENDKPRIVLIGSVFGGTGASGLPTISKVLRERYGDSIKMGGIFMLPYFSFQEDRTIDSFIAHSTIFEYKSIRALKYYASSRYDKIYDHIYLIGSRERFSFDRFQIGGEGQMNPITIVDLVAATAVRHFFARDFNRSRSPKLSYFNADAVKKGNETLIRISSLAVPARDSNDRPIQIRVITFINLFIIFSLFMLLWFPDGAMSPGFKEFNLSDRSYINSKDKDGISLLTKYIPFIEHFLRFVNEVLQTTTPRRTLFADILIDALKPTVTEAVKMISVIAQRRSNRGEYRSFEREYKRVLGILNRYVTNEVAAIGKYEGFKSDDEFVLTVYASIVKNIKKYIPEVETTDSEWAEVMDERTLSFIINLLSNITNILSIFSGMITGGRR